MLPAVDDGLCWRLAAFDLLKEIYLRYRLVYKTNVDGVNRILYRLVFFRYLILFA